MNLTEIKIPSVEEIIALSDDSKDKTLEKKILSSDSVNINEVLTTSSKRAIALERLKTIALNRLTPKAPTNPKHWLDTVYPNMNLVGFGGRHKQLWDWAASINSKQPIHPFVAVWPRGSGKSTTAELVAVYLGAMKKRFYVWYVSGTQSLADLHVESIGALIENPTFEEYYPRMSQRSVGKFGNVRGWRRNRLRAANGFTIDALGLDTGARGSKIEEQRPDFIILDDIDEVNDSLAATEKKIKTITNSILPAGSTDVAVLAIQNLILNDGVFGRIVNNNADYLLDAEISGPFPAIYNLEVKQEKGKFFITNGKASWEGQNLEICQKQINTWGYSAFLRESQHEISDEGSLFGHIQYQRIDKEELPDFVRIVTVVDPAVTSTDSSDSHGINISGLDEEGKIYHLYSFEKVVTPKESLMLAIEKSIEFGSETLYVEVNQGGTLWSYLYNSIVEELGIEDKAPNFIELKVTTSDGGKIERANGMLADYERGNIYHLRGTHEILEAALNRFPVKKPFDLVDASVHCHKELKSGVTWAVF